jgi:hypothetical protein
MGSILGGAQKYQGNIIGNEPDDNQNFSGFSQPPGEQSKTVQKHLGRWITAKHFEEEKSEATALQSTKSKTRSMTGGQNSSINTTSKKRKYQDVDDPRLSNYNRSFMQHVEDEAEEEEDDIKQVNARQLERHMKSKKQLYACLTLEGNLSIAWHI